MENDEMLHSFFSEMKKQDQQLEIPEFPEAKVKAINWWLPSGIAASFLVGCFWFFQLSQAPEAPAEVIIISLEQGENNGQQIIIEEKAFIDTWESTTSSLLTDF